MNKRHETPNSLAIGYVRVSTAEQTANGVSLAAQEERITAYCNLSGLSLVHVVREEGVSATVALSDRPAGAQVIAAVKKGLQHVVALKLDRLFRDAGDALTQTRIWERTNISLHLVDFGGTSINGSSAVGRLMLGMLAGFAQFERDLIAERTTIALQHKKAHRQVYNHEPFGFVRRGKSLIPSPEEQSVMVQILRWRAQGKTLACIADTLNSSGIPTKRAGGKWFPSTIKNVLESSLHDGSNVG